MTQAQDEYYAFVGKIATMLDETDKAALNAIKSIVVALGGKETMQLLRRVLEIEEQGGMLIKDGSRRRTPGGIFIYLGYRHPAYRRMQRRRRAIRKRSEKATERVK